MIIYYHQLVKYGEIFNKDWIIYPCLCVHTEIAYTIINLNKWYKVRK